MREDVKWQLKVGAIPETDFPVHDYVKALKRAADNCIAIAEALWMDNGISTKGVGEAAEEFLRTALIAQHVVELMGDRLDERGEKLVLPGAMPRGEKESDRE